MPHTIFYWSNSCHPHTILIYSHLDARLVYSIQSGGLGEFEYPPVFLFLAVCNSSIDQWVTLSLTDWGYFYFWHTNSDPLGSLERPVPFEIFDHSDWFLIIALHWLLIKWEREAGLLYLPAFSKTPLFGFRHTGRNASRSRFWQQVFAIFPHNCHSTQTCETASKITFKEKTRLSSLLSQVPEPSIPEPTATQRKLWRWNSLKPSEPKPSRARQLPAFSNTSNLANSKATLFQPFDRSCCNKRVKQQTPCVTKCKYAI